MTQKADWLRILEDCKTNIRQKMSLFLKTENRPPRDLGTGAGGDPIKEVDMIAENAIVDTLERRRISFTLISEESGVKRYGSDPELCYVTADPIDGTTNLIRGIPFYATSIALSAKPTLDAVHSALVADLFHDVTYTAQKSCGSYRDNKKVTPSKKTSLEDAVIGIDLNSYKIKRIAPRLTSVIQKAKHVRHFGANALEICYVADGTTDVFIDIRGKLRTTDIAAAWLIMQEAGGMMTSPESKPLNPKLDPRQKVEFVAACNQRMHTLVLDLVKPSKEAG